MRLSIWVTSDRHAKVRTRTPCIERGSPWENGYCECLNGEIFHSLKEPQILIEPWRVWYNTQRPQSAAGLPAAGAACIPEPVSQLRAVMKNLTLRGTRDRSAQFITLSTKEPL